METADSVLKNQLKTGETTTSLGKCRKSLLERLNDAAPVRLVDKPEDELADWKEKNRERFRKIDTSLEKEDWGITFETLTEKTEGLKRLEKWKPALKKGALLLGNYGAGKTTLCKALINRFASRQCRCLYITEAEALQNLKNSFDNREVYYEVELKKLITPDILFLDEMRVKKPAEWVEEVYLTVMKQRWEAGKHMFFTTNHDSKGILQVYGPRIHSRLLEYCSWVTFTSEDLRKKQFVNEI